MVAEDGRVCWARTQEWPDSTPVVKSMLRGNSEPTTLPVEGDTSAKLWYLMFQKRLRALEESSISSLIVELEEEVSELLVSLPSAVESSPGCRVMYLKLPLLPLKSTNTFPERNFRDEEESSAVFMPWLWPLPERKKEAKRKKKRKGREAMRAELEGGLDDATVTS